MAEEPVFIPIDPFAPPVTPVPPVPGLPYQPAPLPEIPKFCSEPLEVHPDVAATISTEVDKAIKKDEKRFRDDVLKRVKQILDANPPGSVQDVAAAFAAAGSIEGPLVVAKILADVRSDPKVDKLLDDAVCGKWHIPVFKNWDFGLEVDPNALDAIYKSYDDKSIVDGWGINVGLIYRPQHGQRRGH
jgi:hypothetical protein